MQDLLLSGIQPTNNLHLGNYIGAIKQWQSLQNTYPCFFPVVDLHAITVAQDPIKLRQQTLEVAATYLACGIDPKRSTIFIQSEIPQHSELMWLLSTIAKMGEMERMTQYKDKSQKHGDNTSLGLFNYPVLMSADILLYDTTVVPVGEDQLQHVELTRDLAQRFNSHFGETFTLPKPLIQKEGARIMGLDDASKKMSKSAASSYNYIALSDDADTIQKKIMKAQTDTEGGIRFDPEAKPAVSNLMTILHHMTGKSLASIESEFANSGYGDFKRAVADAIIAHISPISTKIHDFMDDPTELNMILDAGRKTALEKAQAKLKIVKDQMGIGR